LNDASVTVTGGGPVNLGDASDIYQTGNENEASITMGLISNGSSTIIQTGNVNDAIVIALDSGIADITQTGNENIASIDSGFYSAGSTAFITQNGDLNTGNIVQGTLGNAATINQTGNSNTSNIYQDQ